MWFFNQRNYDQEGSRMLSTYKPTRIAVTGELGFIGRNLVRTLQLRDLCYAHVPLLNADGTEMCVHSTPFDAWCAVLHKVDVLVHNAAIVGSDVVDLRPEDAYNVNVVGTEVVVRAANLMGVPVVYMGTTACYDCTKYQHCMMDEDSAQHGHTEYGRQKLVAENWVKRHAKQWMVVRPLFCYGGVGDMNSLISKSLYAKYTCQQVHMHLDPKKYKDWLHVDDFVEAILLCIDAELWGNVWNASYMSPVTPYDVVKYAETELSVIWHPDVDYMGNHLVSSGRLRAMGWSPKVSLQEGIERAAAEIVANLDSYDPLRYSKEMYNDK